MMSLIERITENEKEAMKKWIGWYAGVESDDKVDIEKNLQYWNREKTTLYKIFGEQLILTKDIEYKMDFDELLFEVETKLFAYTSKAKTFLDAYRKLTYCSGPSPYHEKLSSLIYSDNLAGNIYKDETFSLNLPNDKILIVQSGSKISKILGKIAKAFDLPGYEEFRILHSQALNQKTLKGKLCVSIHPFDYMTMSDNDCGWCSCMSWAEDGEYRGGTVEMMNSPCVVVAYLASETPYQIDNNFNWSNKKWRQLFIVNTQVITGIKQYPYFNSAIEKITCDWLKELAEKNCNWEYVENLITYKHHEATNEGYTFTFETDTMYNDFSSCKHIAYVGTNADNSIYINYSGVQNCMSCGNASESFDSDAELVCDSCNHYIRCAECGEKIYADDAIMIDCLPYCNYCYDSISSICQICEATHHVDSMEQIHLFRSGKNSDEIVTTICINICSECLKELSEDPIKDNLYFKSGTKVINYYHNWKVYNLINIENCTKEGLELFGLYDIEDIEDIFYYKLEVDKLS